MAVAGGLPNTNDSATPAGESRDPAMTGNRMNRQRNNSTELAGAVLESLDWLDLGVTLTDSSGKLLFANRTAEQLLASRDGVEVLRGGAIGTVNRNCSRPLRVAIQLAAQEPLAQAALDSMALVVPRSPEKRPLTLFVRPVEGQAAGSSTRNVLTFMLDPDGPISASESDLGRLYGFTSAEARLAKLLIAGSTFNKCCVDLDIRPSTARMHLGNLYAKTGVQRQGQLIAVLLKSVGMVRMESTVPSNKRDDQYEVSAREGRTKCSATDILAGGLEALDSLHIGVAVINSLREVLFANDTAHQILSAGDGLEVTAHGVLGASKRNLIPFLSATGQQANTQSKRQSTPTDSVVALPRSRGRRPLIVVFRRLNSAEETANLHSPATLVFMLDPELPIPPVESRLRELFGFTSCEARLAHLLMEGHALEGCCQRMGIRASTARMHLTSMFGKVGVQRQGSLISLLLKSACMVRINHAGKTARRFRADVPEATNPFRGVESEARENRPSTFVVIRDQRTGTSAPRPHQACGE